MKLFSFLQVRIKNIIHWEAWLIFLLVLFEVEVHNSIYILGKCNRTVFLHKWFLITICIKKKRRPERGKQSNFGCIATRESKNSPSTSIDVMFLFHAYWDFFTQTVTFQRLEANDYEITSFFQLSDTNDSTSQCESQYVWNKIWFYQLCWWCEVS